MVSADRNKIGQVVYNLISNAVKYSPNGSTIQVSCTFDQEFAYISAKDQGRGIKPEDAVHIFDRYYRVESENMHLISGFGIGLYLWSEIISHHKGSIAVKVNLGKALNLYLRCHYKLSIHQLNHSDERRSTISAG